MDQPSGTVQNLDDTHSEILRKRLLNSAYPPVICLPAHNNSQQNVQLNNIRTATSNSMILPVVPSQNSITINTNIFNQTIPSFKIQTNNQTYPLQLHIGSTQGISTVNVPVQIPGPSSSMPLQIQGNSNMPVQMSGQVQMSQTPTNMPLQLTSSTLATQMQVATTNVPVQLQTGTTINVPLQLPSTSHGLHIGNPNMSLMQNTTGQTFNNPIYVQVGNNNGHITSVAQTSESNPSHLNANMQNINTSSSAASSGVRGGRNLPQVVYIQTPTGLKSVNSSEILSSASTSGNPPQIVVRRPNTSGVFLSNINNKASLPQKAQIITKSSLLSGNNTQQILIQKPKSNNLVPVNISTSSSKPTYAYCVKKQNAPKSESQSILLPSSQANTTSQANQKLFITPMNMPKLPNSTKLVVPPNNAMTSKGPIINLQISNGQIQNDSQGNITVMRDADSNQKDTNSLKKQPPSENQNKQGNRNFTTSIPGSRVEQTGEQEYTLSIPETNSLLNEDIYTVSITDEHNDSKSFTLSIPDKGKSLINNRSESSCIPAPAILRRSYSDNIEKKSNINNLKRRISLCNENILNKPVKTIEAVKIATDNDDSDNNDDHRVPSLFCDEKLDKDLEGKPGSGGNGTDEDRKEITVTKKRKLSNAYVATAFDFKTNSPKANKEVLESSEEDYPIMQWNDGVAQIKGSSLQFQKNEFGLIDIVESDVEDNYDENSTLKYHTPLKQRNRTQEKKPTSPEDMYCCDNCGCHGMAAEFITPNFCSHTCKGEYDKTNKKRDRLDLLKRRNKLKKIMMRQKKAEDVFQYKDDEDPGKMYDFTSNENSSSMFDQCVIKTEDPIENEKYPWMCGKNGFSWIKYLDFCKAKAAPVKLFKYAFPSYKNGFKVGMKLEAIDPIHPPVFAVVTVVEIQGYRMRLHFDGFSDSFDFWVNADSPDIFPPGYREKHNKSVRPPKGMDEASFSWPLYLKQCKAIAAPKHLFPHLSATIIRPNCFRIGMKLEAEDRKNNLACVASVADIMDNRLLINFDSWDDIYDYWVEPTSPYIHPIYWAEENGKSLTLPDFYKNPEDFTWKKYLAETGASAVPARAFKPRPPLDFEVGMKLEVVDKRVPFLIRVATISAMKDYRLCISFDGWPDELSYWLDDDSPDIHPVGWCLKTGHPLEPPLTAEELAVCGPCGTPGCTGLGSQLGGGIKSHSSRKSCPYSGGSRSPAIRERLPAPHPPARTCPPHKAPRSRGTSIRGRPPKNPSTTSNFEEKTSYGRGRPPKHRGSETASKCSDQNWDDNVENEVDLPWEGAEDASDPREWPTAQVAALAARLAGPRAAGILLNHGVGGMEFLAVSKSDLQSIGLKLGPVVKLYAAILKLRKTAIAHYRRQRH